MEDEMIIFFVRGVYDLNRNAPASRLDMRKQRGKEDEIGWRAWSGLEGESCHEHV